MAEAERVADLVNVGLVSVAIYSGLAVERAAVTGNPVGADVDGCRNHRSRAGIVVGLESGHRAVVIEGDVRRTGGLDERDVGDLVPGLQRRLREKLLGGRQSADIVADGRCGPVMGNRVVELPKAVGQIVRELRDGCDRLCGTADRRCRTRGGKTCQRKGIAFVAGRVGKIWMGFLHRTAHVTTNLQASNAANHGIGSLVPNPALFSSRFGLQTVTAKLYLTDIAAGRRIP